ncbi:unnamed protein product [Lepeophtheirus salmonis]|uniref:(salmon louse) hypothetical protein n=1 Tax=Lepeophtheirus salmonis TaxID=72036 RepID=A0A7R8H8B2_LEPSM|nr:unnamed protein product [Lepeophtheirus salmonis]CAF2919801.1 unnamed protein product [Lepeophtheirus salmonis]
MKPGVSTSLKKKRNEKPQKNNLTTTKKHCRIILRLHTLNTTLKEKNPLFIGEGIKREFPCKSQKEKLLEKCYVCFKRFDPDKLFDHKKLITLKLMVIDKRQYGI